jgi:hypothetical protein
MKEESDVVVFLAFVARVFFGLAITTLAVTLAVMFSSTLHARAYSMRSVAPQLALLTSECSLCCCLAGGLVTRSRVLF